MFIQLRLTPSECAVNSFEWAFEKNDLASNKLFWFHLCSYIFGKEVGSHLALCSTSRVLIASESQNKFGEPTSPHYHINIHVEKQIKKDAFQKWLNRHGAKGNKAYCLQIREDVEDEGRWWRYCCKENLAYAHGFSTEDLSKMVEMATSERAHQVSVNVKTRDRLVAKNQFRDKMFKYLDEKHPDIQNKRKLIKIIGQYYQDQGKTPPFNKLADVALDYLIFAKKISWDEWIEVRYE